jgi:hypothetical protein
LTISNINEQKGHYADRCHQHLEIGIFREA